jgi:Cysteine-rich secretory protein family
MKYYFTILLSLAACTIARCQTEKDVYNDPSFIKAVLDQHNVYRSALNLPLLTWRSTLASDALAWAKQIAKMDQGQHDPHIRAVNEGENIWWGTTGAFGFAQMVDFWAAERKDFVYGVFPDVKSRHSAVVGHYTQMVWKRTTSVGCAVAGNGQKDFLVCRYSPPGNVEGQKPY